MRPAIPLMCITRFIDTAHTAGMFRSRVAPSVVRWIRPVKGPLAGWRDSIPGCACECVPVRGSVRIRVLPSCVRAPVCALCPGTRPERSLETWIGPPSRTRRAGDAAATSPRAADRSGRCADASRTAAPLPRSPGGSLADSCSDRCAPVKRAQAQRWREIAVPPRELTHRIVDLSALGAGLRALRAVEGAARSAAGPVFGMSAYALESRSWCAPSGTMLCDISGSAPR